MEVWVNGVPGLSAAQLAVVAVSVMGMTALPREAPSWFPVTAMS